MAAFLYVQGAKCVAQMRFQFAVHTVGQILNYGVK